MATYTSFCLGGKLPKNVIAIDSWDFVTSKINNNNRRDTLKYKGVPLTIICEAYNLNYGAIRRRINTYGWEIGRAITTPIRKFTKRGGV